MGTVVEVPLEVQISKLWSVRLMNGKVRHKKVPPCDGTFELTSTDQKPVAKRTTSDRHSRGSGSGLVGLILGLLSGLLTAAVLLDRFLAGLLILLARILVQVGPQVLPC